MRLQPIFFDILGLGLFFEIYLSMYFLSKLFIDLEIQGCEGQKQD